MCAYARFSARKLGVRAHHPGSRDHGPVGLVASVSAAVTALAERQARVVVAIDGPDAAGKTTLADQLAASLPAVRLSVDDFLQPPDVRYRRGELSPEGYYRDSVDDGRLALAIRGLTGPIVLDGVFLQRPQLAGLLDLVVYLRVSPEESLRRALIRDVGRFGSAQEVERRYRERYLPGQALYRAEFDPEGRADVLIDNEDPARPRVLRAPAGPAVSRVRPPS